jgi:glycosyltransferase involved in cell wall biosynthesis
VTQKALGAFRVSGSSRRVTNILLTCSSDAGTGGVQQVFRDLIRALEANQRHVHLLYQAPLPAVRLTRGRNAWGHEAFYCAMPTLVKDNVFLGLAVSLVYLPITLFHLVRLLRGKKIDAINCHYLAEYFIHLVIAARLLRLPVVISVHGADIDRYERIGRAQRFLVRLIMRGADRIVACSDAMARQTSQTFPSARGKVTHIHNGLDFVDFTRAEGAPAITNPFVLSVCRQVDKKGVDTLVRAFALLEHEFPDLSLMIIGDGPALEQNRALARALGIERRVAFMGEMAHARVLPYFSACTLFVVPSRAEPFGLVLLEAAYYKKGMVCTRAGGIPEIVTDNVSAFLVEADDPVAMAAKMAILLRDPELAARLGQRAHEILMTRFRWEDRVKDYIAVYEGAGASATQRDEASSSQSPSRATTGAKR